MKIYRKKFLSMGCPCEIGVYSPLARKAERAIIAASNEVHRLDRKYSHFRPDSYITRLQSAAQHATGAMVDGETASLLDYAARQFAISSGLFDISAGNLSRLWHRRHTMPTKTELSRALQFTGWSKINWQSPQLKIPRGMALELGGLVKEYAADRAGLVLLQHGMQSAYVELGGDIHVTGPRPDGTPWKMGVRKPAYRQKSSACAMAEIGVYCGGLATSGDYERANIINGEPYGHIIHPETGWPVSSFQSISVLAPSCLVAGSLSTLAMLMEHEQGIGMLRESGFTWLTQAMDGTRCLSGAA